MNEKNELLNVLKVAMKPIIIFITIALIIILILSAAVYFLNIKDGIYAEGNMANVPYASGQFTGKVNINGEKINTEKTAQEIWDEIIENGGEIEKYLEGPEELLKLMNAQLVTQYLDTRSNPDAEIDWNTLNNDVNSKEIQGIVKLKRESNNGEPITMSYVDPTTFQTYIDNYLNSGREEDKNIALSHFTLERTITSTTNSGTEEISGDTNILYWPTDGTTITSNFGLRDQPTEGASTNHKGIDIGVAEGTNVYACDNGEVIMAEYTDYGGNMIKVDHGNGYVSVYEHNKELKVSVGDTVTKGEIIAISGNTGNSTGPHLHFQINYNDEAIDPLSINYANGMGGLESEITTSTWYAKIAILEETTETVTYDGALESEEITYGMSTTNLNYQKFLSGYTMPFNYLWALLVIGEDKDLVLELADLVYNSKIELTVYDNLTVTTTTVVNTYTDDDEKTHTTINETVQKDNIPEIDLTKADVWIVKYTKEHNYEITDNTEYINNDTISTKYYQYIAQPENIQEKTDKNATENNFVKIFIKNQKGKQNILNVVSWLYEILEENEDTVDMVDLTKYLIYKSTGEEQGITEFDFSVFNPNNFISISGIYGNTIQEKIWFAILSLGYSKEAAAGVLGNIEWESHFNASIVEGGYTEDNGGIGICQWTNYPRNSGEGRNQQLKEYANSKGTTWQDEDTQIEYLMGELLPSGGANGYASYALISYNGYSPSDWINALTPEDAAIAFCWTFERPVKPNMSNRTESAREYYEQFKDKEMGSSTELLQAIDEVALYLVNNNYTYKSTNEETYSFPILENGKTTLSCSSFIQECLLKAGYTQCAGNEKIYARNTVSLAKSDFEKLGIQVDVITDMNTLQPGDIVYNGPSAEYHVFFIYSVSGNKVQIKGVPEVLNSWGEFNGISRDIKRLKSDGCFALRIRN